MPTALEQLEEMVRHAEAEARSQKLEGEIRQATDRLRDAEARARAADGRLREGRPERLRALEEAETERKRLDQVIKQMARMRLTQAGKEELVLQAQREVEQKRAASRAELEALVQEYDAARKELMAALELYRGLRRELDRLQPTHGLDLAAGDRLAHSAEQLLPAARIYALVREIDDGTPHFGALDPREQFAQLKIWIGRFRQLQDLVHGPDGAAVSDEEREILERVHPRLVALSKQHQPGYIRAFQKEYTADWDQFIAEAQEDLVRATEEVRHRKERERQRRDVLARREDQQKQARIAGREAIEYLKAVVDRGRLPEIGAEDFRSALARIVAAGADDDPEVIELIRPHRDLVDDSDDFRPLRRNLARAENEAIRERCDDLLPATRGLRALMVGGIAREEVRRKLERVFEFDELDWTDYGKPALIDSLEQRVRNRGVDLILILKGFNGHAVSERLRPLCEQQSIPCLMVETGYGVSQVAETLRKGLLKEERR
jgi:hypothetical protein